MLHGRYLRGSLAAANHTTGGHTSVVGAVALLVTIIGLGSQSVPIKLAAVVKSRMAPSTVIMCFSLGALLAGLVLLPAIAVLEALSNPNGHPDALVSSDGVNLIVIDGIESSLLGPLWNVVKQGRWGAAAACFYAPGKILQLLAVRRIGVGLSTGIIASVNSITAFVFVGGMILAELPSNMAGASTGIVLLLLGAIGMTACKSNESDPERPLKASSSTVSNSGSAGAGVDFHPKLVHRTSSIRLVVTTGEPEPEPDTASGAGVSCGSGNSSLDWPGIAAALVSGVCLGFQSLPFRYGTASSTPAPYATAAVFLLAQAPITLVLLAFTTGFGVGTKSSDDATNGSTAGGDYESDEVASFLPTTVPSPSKTKAEQTLTFLQGQVPFDANAVMLSMVGGIIFSAAAVGQIISISSFGATVGMPLTQLNLIVAGLWGICFFGEIRQRGNALMFFACAALALVGGALLHG